VDLADGVYAVSSSSRMARDGWRGLCGSPTHYYRPESGSSSVPARLRRDLYGEKIRVVIGKRVREQRSHGTEDELVEQ